MGGVGSRMLSYKENGDDLREATQMVLDDLREATQINLSSTGLTMVPSWVLQQSACRYLNLSDNAIAMLPPELGTLSLIKLDLHGNAIEVLPPQLGQLSNLRVLHARYNKIRMIPLELTQLSNLEKLSLAANKIELIPAQLSLLLSLRHLNLGTNSIKTLPSQLCSLSNLKKLHLHSNQIEVIPPELSQLLNLEILSFSENRITRVPRELALLSNLEVLFLSGNQIQRLPRELSRLTKLRCFFVDKNPLKTPPVTVVTGWHRENSVDWSGFDNYFDARRHTNKDVKVIIFGESRGGRSSVLNGLLVDFPQPALINDTKFLAARQTFDEGKYSWLGSWRVTWLDFGAQPEYRAMQQIFFTPEALYMLVVDVRKLEDDVSLKRSREWLDRWLDMLEAKVPGAVVLPVLTHRDRSGLAEAAAKQVLKGLLEQHARTERPATVEGRLPLCPLNVLLDRTVLVSSLEGDGLVSLQRVVVELLEGGLLPIAGQQVPEYYTKVRDALLAIPRSDSTINWLGWERLVREVGDPLSLDETHVRDAVEYLERTGFVCLSVDWLGSSLAGVFLQPSQLYEAVRDLYSSEQPEVETPRNNCTMSQESVENFQADLYQLVCWGILARSLLAYLWRKWLPSEEARKGLLEMLLRCGLLLTAADPMGQHLIVPFRLRRTRPGDLAPRDGLELRLTFSHHSFPLHLSLQLLSLMRVARPLGLQAGLFDDGRVWQKGAMLQWFEEKASAPAFRSYTEEGEEGAAEDKTFWVAVQGLTEQHKQKEAEFFQALLELVQSVLNASPGLHPPQRDVRCPMCRGFVPAFKLIHGRGGCPECGKIKTSPFPPQMQARRVLL